MRRAAVVYNPVAGARDAARLAGQAQTVLEREGWQVALHATSGPGAGEPLARSLAESIELLVVAGGDGSVREAIAGLGAHAARVTVAVLPCGNANVAARELGIPLSPKAALDVLRTGRVRAIDLGRVGDDLFLAMVGFGWDARTIRILARLRGTRLGGWWYQAWADSAYFVAGFAAVLARRRQRFRITADGRAADAGYCGGLVANFRCYGKGWAMVPDASATSGRLHYQVRKRAGPLFIAWQLIAAMFRRRTPAFVSDYGDAREITVAADHPFPVQVDGDDCGSFGEVRIRVEPGAARLLAPEL